MWRAPRVVVLPRRGQLRRAHRPAAGRV